MKKIKKALGILFFLVIFLVGGFLLYLLHVSKEERLITKELLENKKIDCIIIFTGDMGRIPLGLKLAKKYQAPKIFITGVYNRNTLPILLETLPKDVKENLQSENDWIEIDYSAQNTIGNVLSSLQFLRKENKYKNIVIISSDYHIMRIKLIVNKFSHPDDIFQLYYMPVKTIRYNWRTIKLIIKEIIKSISAKTILFFWEEDS